MNRLKIIADENIPAVAEVFGQIGEVSVMPGWAIQPNAISDSDALLVRSVTRVCRKLVAGTRLKFVGSATIGTDHVDEAALQDLGISFAYAPGSNAESVVGYVLAALVTVARRLEEELRGKLVGIVGCGNVGGRVAARLRALGLDVLVCDPPLADRMKSAGFTALEELFARCDILSLHVPLTVTGNYPTYHMIDADALRRVKPGCWLVNTSRGAVVDTAALKRAITDGVMRAAVLDVWENEPNPDAGLIALSQIATPHIAGYSVDGKLNGTRMLFDALMQTLSLQGRWPLEEYFADEPLSIPDAGRFSSETSWLAAVLTPVYDIEQDDRRMRAMLDLPDGARAGYFHELRRTYPRRRDFSHYVIDARRLSAHKTTILRDGMGFQVR